MDDKCFIKRDVVKMIKIIRDLIGGETGSICWGGSTALDARGITIPESYSVRPGILNPGFSTPESDVDIVVVNPYMASKSLTVALECLALVEGLHINITPGDDNGNYEGLPISRRFIVKGLSRDIDLILCNRTGNAEASMGEYVASIDSDLVAESMVRVRFSGRWMYPERLSLHAANSCMLRDLNDLSKIRGHTSWGERQEKLLRRLTNLKNLLQNV